MNDLLKSIFAELGKLGGGSRTVAAIAGLALVVALGIGAWVARTPHFELLYGNLDEAENAKVQKALADAGIPYEASSPPGPYSVHVARDSRIEAIAAIGSAGALDPDKGGIPSASGGLASAFLGSDERAQVVMKRRWEEMESMLEQLDFVAGAEVRTSMPAERYFGEPEALSASVTLALRGGRVLDREQALSVAGLVRFGLGVEPDRLVITDQLGNALFDGSRDQGIAGEAASMLEMRAAHDRDLTQRASTLLESILGPGKARVMVSSDWDFDQTSSVSESSDPDSKVVTSEMTSTTKTPQGTGLAASQAGGAPGADSNVPNGNAPSGAGAAPAVASSAPSEAATTSESQKEYFTPRETKTSVRLAPRLARLSVALVLDEALAARSTELERSVKAAVGFSDERKDVFSTIAIPFATTGVITGAEGADGTAADAAGAPAASTEPAAEIDAGPSRMVELLIEKSVEIAAALAFVALLFKSLKGGGRRAGGDATLVPAGPGGVQARAELDPEQLARAQAEQLAKSDPARVGQVLSSWAREDRTAGARR